MPGALPHSPAKPLHLHIQSLRVGQALPFCAAWLLLHLPVTCQPFMRTYAACGFGRRALPWCMADSAQLPDRNHPATVYTMHSLKVEHIAAVLWCMAYCVPHKGSPVQEGVQRRGPCVSVRSLPQHACGAIPREASLKHGMAAEKWHVPEVKWYKRVLCPAWCERVIRPTECASYCFSRLSFCKRNQGLTLVPASRFCSLLCITLRC